jgi:hypothetical protein
VRERCWEENPALELTGDDAEHSVACWYPAGEEDWRTIGSTATSSVTPEQAASRASRGEEPPAQVSAEPAGRAAS